MMRNTDFAILSVSLLGLGGESYAVKCHMTSYAVKCHMTSPNPSLKVFNAKFYLGRSRLPFPRLFIDRLKL
jgi:hypothetical protein